MTRPPEPIMISIYFIQVKSIVLTNLNKGLGNQNKGTLLRLGEATRRGQDKGALLLRADDAADGQGEGSGLQPPLHRLQERPHVTLLQPSNPVYAAGTRIGTVTVDDVSLNSLVYT